ncbi:MAG: HAD family hydrolase [Saprospiraceae bacterium]
MVKGLIFDMDGTMVDNMMIHHRAWQRKLSALGLEMTIDEVKEKIHGVNEEIIKRTFGDRFTASERKQIAWEKEEEYRNIFLPELKLIDGLIEFLEAAKAANIPMAIGTAAPPENANFILDNLNLGHYFKGVFHSGSVTKGKPDPQIFEKAAASMGLKTSDCVIFEDSITGAEAAKRANAPSVIVTTTHEEAEFAHFDNVAVFIKDYTKLSLEEVMSF